MTTTVALIALFVLCIGLAMLAANPGRLTNQVFAFGALLLGAELFTIHESITAGAIYYINNTTLPLFWIRLSSSLFALFPWLLWLLFKSISQPHYSIHKLPRRTFSFLIMSIIISLFSFSDWHIPSISRPTSVAYGPLYYTQSSILSLLFILIFLQSAISARHQTGFRRLEMQLIVVNLSVSSTITVLFFILGNLYRIYFLKQLAIFSILAAFCITAIILTVPRVFNPIQIIISCAQKLLVAACFFILFTIQTTAPNNSSRISLETAGIICTSCLLLSWLDRSTRIWLGLDGGKSHTKLRKMVIEAARAEPSRTHLVTQFEHILQTHYGSKQASFLFNQKGCYRAGEKTLQKHSAGYDSLCKIGWATPESLERRRPTPGLTELGRMLDTHGLALVCPIPRGNPEPSLLITLSTKQSSAPFTYPEIERIQNIAELMDNLLLRSQLSSQLEMQTRLESVADISRSLAHDLKNLITPVSAFLKTLENERTPHFSETPIYSAARQSIRVINDYIDEAHFFSKQLAPRIEFVEPYNLLKEAAATLQEKADRKSIRIEVLPSTTEPIYADRVLLIRLLTNLADNAIDASTSGGHINMHTERTIDGKLKFSVSDSGTGIPPDILPRIFEPYFTTKDLGNEVRGFGLGLAINQRIVDLYEGEIHVRTAVGAGTTFEVTIPQKSTQPTGSLSPAQAINSDKHPLVA